MTVSARTIERRVTDIAKDANNQQTISHMKFILSSQRCRLTEDHSEACVQLEVTRYSPKITELSKEKQEQRFY